MQDFERRKIQKAIDEIELSMLELKIQVLNNVDAQMAKAGANEADKSAVRTFVKQPIMQTLSRLNVSKLNLMKLLSPGPQPHPKTPQPLNQTGGPLQCPTHSTEIVHQ